MWNLELKKQIFCEENIHFVPQISLLTNIKMDETVVILSYVWMNVTFYPRNAMK